MRERQVSFAGGEFSPHLWGRTDLARYSEGARRLRNFLVTNQGIAVNRPGAVHVSSVSALTDNALLVPFHYADGKHALLLFNGSVDAWELDSNGAMQPVAEVRPPGGLVPLPWPIAPSPVVYGQVRIAQVGYRLILTAPGCHPSEIFRTPGTGGGVSYTWRPLQVARREARWYDATGYLTQERPFSGDASHPPREWQWAVSTIRRDRHGYLYETAAQAITKALPPPSSGTYESIADYVAAQLVGGTPVDLNAYGVPFKAAVYPDYPMRIIFSGQQAAPAPDEGDTPVAVRIYRGRDGYFGYVGETTNDYFLDEGATPDFSRPPSFGVHPFATHDGHDFPACVAHFEGRRLFAGTSQRPDTVWGSGVEDFANFDEVLFADDADPYEFTLASSKLEHIRALVPRKGLLAMTSAGEWLVTGSGQGEVITPLSIAAHPVTEHGSAPYPAPVSIASAVFFVQAKGATPRALVFTPDGTNFQSVDISLASRHLFRGRKIVDWAYAEDPYSILWVACDDGALLSMTWVPEQQMAAWAHHQLADGGKVEALCTIPEGDEDALYMVVRRGNQRTLERLASRNIDDVRDGIFLDRAATYDGRNKSEVTVTVEDAGSGGAIGETVHVTFSEAPDAGIPEGKVMQILDPAGGLPLLVRVGTDVSGTKHEAEVLNTPVPASLWGVATDQWGIAIDTVTGLSHLDGLKVSALVDGDVVEGLQVTARSVTLPTHAVVVHVGRPYVSQFESLAISQERGRQKVVKTATLELEGSRGGWVGPDLDTLTEVRTRERSHGYGAIPLKREEVRIPVPGRWESTGYVALEQREPLPVALIGITREYELGG